MKLKGVLAAVVLFLFSFSLLGGEALSAQDGEGVVLILPASADVQGRWMILGEIGKVSGPAGLAAEVAAVNVGAAPGAGITRRLTKGQIEVRLRQAKLDLAKIEFQGADVVQVFGAAASGSKTAAAGNKADGSYRVVVAARDLSRGEIISLADLTVEEREIGHYRIGFENPEDLVGLRTTRHIRLGTELTASSVERIPAVERGASVTILVQAAGLSVSAPGVARGTGHPGEVIPVENALSRKIIYAEIVDAETVQVNIRGSSTP